MRQTPPQIESRDHWSGWTLSPDHIPLDKIRKDGYDLIECEDERGKFYRIIKSTLKNE